MLEPTPAGQQAGERRYRVYGATVASRFPFQTPLIPAKGPPDLTFTLVSNPPESGPWRDSTPIFESRYLTEDGEPQMLLYRHGDLHVFRQVGLADYYMWSDRIVCHQHDQAATDVVELSFLSLLTSFWLESRGAVVLHASAVSVHGRAAVFLATNMGGKTSLSASLMQMGHQLMTDDLLAVSLADEEAVAHPGFPQMRMWPDLADYFLGGHAHLPLVVPETDKRRVAVGEEAFGAFCRDDRPLSRLYLPERVDDSQGPIRVEPIPPQQALIELVRESFLSTVLEKADLHRKRFTRLASLVNDIPVARLVYPSGLDRLPELRGAILVDMGVGR
jgi:hypothetical protein